MRSRRQHAGRFASRFVPLVAVAILASSCSGHSDPLATSANNILKSGPIQVLIEGDSIALTLAIGLSGAQQQYGLHIIDNGALGCGIAQGNPIMLNGALDTLPAGCDNWQQTWKADVTTDQPDVVGILVGRWEVVDRMRGGTWQHIGQTPYDAYLQSQVDKAVHIVGAHGAKVVLFTTPYLYPTFSPVNPDGTGGTQYPETKPQRIDAFNAMLRTEATKYPGVVSIIDLNALLDPGGKYTSVVDGVQTRVPPGPQEGDWDHISIPGGELLGPTVLPQLAKLGAQARQAS